MQSIETETQNEKGEGRVKSTPRYMVQTPCFLKKEKFKNRKKKIAKKFFEERKCVRCKCCVDLSRTSNFVSCVMMYDAVRFVLRHFLGFLACFYLFTLQLIHFSKIRGLEWLKMRFCVSGIIILMLLWCDKWCFCGITRVRMCVWIYILI